MMAKFASAITVGWESILVIRKGALTQIHFLAKLFRLYL
jgi:hypothetical protein